MTALIRFPFAAALAEIEREFDADCVPIDGPLHDARRTLERALGCRSSMLRMDYLYRARDALHAANLPRWAERAGSAAIRIGGDDTDMERLLFDVDCQISREMHA